MKRSSLRLSALCQQLGQMNYPSYHQMMVHFLGRARAEEQRFVKFVCVWCAKPDKIATLSEIGGILRPSAFPGRGWVCGECYYDACLRRAERPEEGGE